MSLKLHCFGESGHSYKAALALELSGLDWQPVFIDFFSGATRSRDYHTELNPMGEAPVLIDGDLTLSQSGVIQDYISEKLANLAARQRLNAARSCAGFCGTITNYLPMWVRGGL